MSIDVESERLLSVAAARAWVGARTGRAPSRQAVARWLSVGIGGVALDSVLIGGRRMTSVEALLRFFDRGNAPPAVEPTRRRQREIEAACRRARELFG